MHVTVTSSSTSAMLHRELQILKLANATTIPVYHHIQQNDLSAEEGLQLEWNVLEHRLPAQQSHHRRKLAPHQRLR
jgi:hypothetical protein